jgi:hypothetical protein
VQLLGAITQQASDVSAACCSFLLLLLLAGVLMPHILCLLQEKVGCTETVINKELVGELAHAVHAYACINSMYILNVHMQHVCCAPVRANKRQFHEHTHVCINARLLRPTTKLRSVHGHHSVSTGWSCTCCCCWVLQAHEGADLAGKHFC